MTTLLAELCTDASQEANLRLPYTSGSLAMHVGSVMEARLLLDDPAEASRSLSLSLAGQGPDQTEEPAASALRIRDVLQLGEISSDRSLPRGERLGALTVLSCLAAAYSATGLEDRRLDALSSASFGVLRGLSERAKTREGRFAAQVLEWIVDDADHGLAEDAAELFAEVAELSAGSAAAGKAAEAKEDGKQTIPLRVENLKTVAKMPWINAAELELAAASKEGLSGEVITLEDQPAAVLCDLTPFNRRTNELVDDVRAHGRFVAAWQYAVRGVTRLAQGETQPHLKGAVVPTLMGGNRRCNSDNFLRTYYVHLGHQDGLPIYGVIAMIRTKANQDSLLRLILPGNFRAREA